MRPLILCIINRVITVFKYALCISVIFAKNKIVFGKIKNEDGNFLKSVNIISMPFTIEPNFLANIEKNWIWIF